MKSAKRERKYRKRLDIILNFYKKLIQLRKELPVIANGTIRFLDEDLDTYLNLTEQMSNSINRILAKSKFVVGDIDFSCVHESNDDQATRSEE